MLVRQRAADPVRLLRHDVHPAPLIAPSETGVGAAVGHVVEHGNILGDSDRIGRGQHDAQLADADPFRLHGEIQIEQHRVVGNLEALDVEMMFGEADRVVAEVVGEPDLFGQLAQHPLIKFGPHAGHARLDLRAAACAWQIEQRCLHGLDLLATSDRSILALFSMRC